MADTGTPPVIPIQFQQYNSYVTDPKWQIKFSSIWSAMAAFFIIRSIPYLVRSIRNGRAWVSFWGIKEDAEPYEPLVISEMAKPGGKTGTSISQLGLLGRLEAFCQRWWSVFYWTIPGIDLNAGQLLILTGYFAAVVVCTTYQVPLMTNSNRAGFIAIAQLPLVFLLGTKNSALSFLLGPGHGWERLNFLHRWSARAMFLCATLHGALWIRNHLIWDIEILGEQKETSGIAAFAVLGGLVIFSVRFVRNKSWEAFWWVHLLGTIAFFITICYHTIYAAPWIFPPLAFHGLDLLLRLVRTRVKDAVLVPVDKQMTLIHIPFATSGWVAGQHVRLRTFVGGAKIWESHPLTIMVAPAGKGCILGITLGARVAGNWTQALNEYARKAGEERLLEDLKLASPAAEKPQACSDRVPVPIHVMVDGPYGGSSVDLGEYETVLLFAGGSGATFTLALLDDIVGRCVKQGRPNGEKTRRIEWAWCVRSFGSIEWFSSALMDIANVAAASLSMANPVHLHISIYVTCLCNPEAVPPIPNCDVTIVRPSIYKALEDLIQIRDEDDSDDLERGRSSMTKESSKARESTSRSLEMPDDCEKPTARVSTIRKDGGVAVAAAGPVSLTREASNAVARVGTRGGLGKVGLHTEVYGI
ncbi:iron reductase [Panaeolus papilionaceus]|nr:iron reductase [Panaeolus papilionaceus]